MRALAVWQFPDYMSSIHTDKRSHVILPQPSSPERRYLDEPRIETLTDGTRFAAIMSDSPVDANEVRHVASLARVDLEEDEVERFTSQFQAILEHFEALDEVPEVEAEPELVNVMREDEVEPSLSQDGALQNAEESEDGRFKGPRVS